MRQRITLSRAFLMSRRGTAVGVGSVESMFDSLVEAALASRASAAVGAWARVENAACARRLSRWPMNSSAMIAADGSRARAVVSGQLGRRRRLGGAAQNVSLGVASHQLLIADGLRERLPRVAEVFAAGAISYRIVAAVVSRTRLIKDPDAMAKVDTEIAAHDRGVGVPIGRQNRAEIDYWVDR